MAATNRIDKIKLLFKALQKRYKHVPKHAERGLLESLMFAACLENASFDAAESAYSVLEHHYIDWNELRVSTPQEIGDTLHMLPQPVEAGERIKKTLQWIFETTYMFDLEDYRKKTIGQMTEYLDSIPSCTPFMTNYLIQIGLGGHLIPFDEGALRIMRRLDLTKVNNGNEEVSGIERAVTKNKGVEFATLMHLIGVEFFDKQDDAELLTLLKTIDKNAAGRSWQEPQGVQRKADAKPPTFARTDGAADKKFQPVIELDDDDDAVDPEIQEDAIEFIDTSLAALGGSASTKDSADPGDLKNKKTAPEKKTPKKKTVETDTEKAVTKMIEETAPKTDEVKSTLKSTDKKTAAENVTDDTKKSAKKTKEKTPPAAVKNDAKKTETPGKSTAKKDVKKTDDKPAKKETKKSPQKPEPKAEVKKADGKSIAKKLQQKKPR